ncbi:MAG: hypothetical protein AB8C13_10475 [Phycisphaerales bacterium]
MTTDSIKIALVGHCRPDIFALTAAIRGFFPGAVVESVNTQDQITNDYQLHLVNRVLDGSFNTGSGIELIKNLPDDSSPAMLITDIEVHAKEALEVGAVPGFGKSSMRSEQAHDALRNALNLESA